MLCNHLYWGVMVAALSRKGAQLSAKKSLRLHLPL